MTCKGKSGYELCRILHDAGCDFRVDGKMEAGYNATIFYSKIYDGQFSYHYAHALAIEDGICIGKD